MALFQGVTGPINDTPTEKFRSNTKLQHSVHDSPAQEFIIDRRLPRLFQYHFGGSGWVTIPKGRIVAPATSGGPDDDGRFLDMDRGAGFLLPALTLANGGVDVTELDPEGEEYVRSANKPIGVAYANLYEEYLDAFNRMQPTVENEIYIELPYISSKESAYEVQWGCLYDVDETSRIKPGDKVMSDENGYFIKADFDKVRKDMESATSVQDLAKLTAEHARLTEQVVGTVWAVDPVLEVQGWLKWVQFSNEEPFSDNRPLGLTPEDLNKDGVPGYPYSPQDGASFDNKKSKYYPQGAKGLTNGHNIVVPIKDELLGYINSGLEGVLKYNFIVEGIPVVPGTLTLKVGDKEVKVERLNNETGSITFFYDSSKDVEQLPVTVSYSATGQIPGVPTNRDFKDSVGAVRILLQL